MTGIKVSEETGAGGRNRIHSRLAGIGYMKLADSNPNDPKYDELLYNASVLFQRSKLQGPAAVGELQWGGLAGTHWFINPVNGLAGVVMCQRHFGFWHPFWFAYKRALYAAAGR